MRAPFPRGSKLNPGTTRCRNGSRKPSVNHEMTYPQHRETKTTPPTASSKDIVCATTCTASFRKRSIAKSDKSQLAHAEGGCVWTAWEKSLRCFEQETCMSRVPPVEPRSSHGAQARLHGASSQGAGQFNTPSGLHSESKIQCMVWHSSFHDNILWDPSKKLLVQDVHRVVSLSVDVSCHNLHTVRDPELLVIPAKERPGCSWSSKTCILACIFQARWWAVPQPVGGAQAARVLSNPATARLRLQ